MSDVIWHHFVGGLEHFVVKRTANAESAFKRSVSIILKQPPLTFLACFSIPKSQKGGGFKSLSGFYLTCWIHKVPESLLAACHIFNGHVLSRDEHFQWQRFPKRWNVVETVFAKMEGWNSFFFCLALLKNRGFLLGRMDQWTPLVFVVFMSVDDRCKCPRFFPKDSTQHKLCF